MGEELGVGRVTCATQIKVDGVKDENWMFEETLLDTDHVVSVAVRDTGEKMGEEFVKMRIGSDTREKMGEEFVKMKDTGERMGEELVKMSIGQLLPGSDSQLRDIDANDWTLFKQMK